MELVGTSRKNKMKNVHSLKLSPLVQIGVGIHVYATLCFDDSIQILLRIILEGLVWSHQRKPVLASPGMLICTNRLMFGKGTFFILVLNSEHASQSRHSSPLCTLKCHSALLCSGG